MCLLMRIYLACDLEEIFVEPHDDELQVSPNNIQVIAEVHVETASSTRKYSKISLDKRAQKHPRDSTEPQDLTINLFTRENIGFSA
ncbi:hypothetical protein Pmani_026286 [Petrolisthes manimaculis]|uniref:Uncharacterized protein n=1 Tax=Petrolisthes manimaculis TaxID=1843537 RepID=A0AAE1P4T7_9EUCA|nr:hypothetical protein Pmani_026286 [Petrolisthes manimaculis]